MDKGDKMKNWMNEWSVVVNGQTKCENYSQATRRLIMGGEIMWNGWKDSR